MPGGRYRAWLLPSLPISRSSSVSRTAAFELRDVREMTLEKHKMTSSLVIRFVDNPVRLFECVKMAKPQDLVDTFHKMQGTRAA